MYSRETSLVEKRWLGQSPATRERQQDTIPKWLVITVRKRSCGKVMFFSQGRVSASVHAGIHPPGQIHPPWPGILPRQTPSPGRHPLVGDTPCPVHAGIHTPPPSACWGDRHGYCCGWYASYWNAFLFLGILVRLHASLDVPWNKCFTHLMECTRLYTVHSELPRPDPYHNRHLSVLIYMLFSFWWDL